MKQKLNSGALMLHMGTGEGTKQENQILGRWPRGSVRDGGEKVGRRRLTGYCNSSGQGDGAKGLHVFASDSSADCRHCASQE